MTTTRSSASAGSPATRSSTSKHPRNREETKGGNAKPNGPKIVTIAPTMWKAPIADVQAYWREITEAIPEAAIPFPFSADSIYGEGETAHELARAAKTLYTPKRNQATPPKQWTAVFQRCFSSTELIEDVNAICVRRLFIKFAWSDPTVIFDQGHWANRELIASDITNAWFATYQLCGAPWRNRSHWFESPADNLPPANDSTEPTSTTNYNQSSHNNKLKHVKESVSSQITKFFHTKPNPTEKDNKPYPTDNVSPTEDPNTNDITLALSKNKTNPPLNTKPHNQVTSPPSPTHLKPHVPSTSVTPDPKKFPHTGAKGEGSHSKTPPHNSQGGTPGQIFSGPGNTPKISKVLNTSPSRATTPNDINDTKPAASINSFTTPGASSTIASNLKNPPTTYPTSNPHSIPTTTTTPPTPKSPPVASLPLATIAKLPPTAAASKPSPTRKSSSITGSSTSSTATSTTSSTSRPPNNLPVPATTVTRHSNHIYISRPIRTPPTHQNHTPVWNKKFSTFFKSRLPKIKTDTPAEQEVEAGKNFEILILKLQASDSSLIVLPWTKRPRLSAIKKGGKFPTTKDDLEQFLDRLFLQKNKSPWSRFRLGHNKETADILTDDNISWARSNDYTIIKEKIQAPYLAKAGFLMGYHPLSLNPNNLEMALKQFKELKGIPIEVRVEYIQISKTLPRSKARAPTIWTTWDLAGPCRIALSMIYSTKRPGDYPLATQARFIPNGLDSRFITSVRARLVLIKAQDKHEAFLAKTSTARSYTILGLDYYIDEYQVTLREAIMSI